MQKNCKKIWSIQKKAVLLHPLSSEEQFFAPSGGSQFPHLSGTLPGAIAQLVEQRTENPCVPSSILGGTTKKRPQGLFFAFIWVGFHFTGCPIISNTCAPRRI